MGKVIEAGMAAKEAGGVANLEKNSSGIQALGQGIHALQDAQMFVVFLRMTTDF